jgi:hypothetical protein
MLSQVITLGLDVAVGVHWPVPGLLSLTATLDNQKDYNLQSFHMGLTSETLSASFGDFPMGPPGSVFASPERQLKGFQVSWHPSDRLTLSAVLAQVQGLFQSRTFRGNAAHGTTTFSLYQPDHPTLEEPYQLSLKGLEYYPLSVRFIPGFTQPKLDFSLTSELKNLLTSYDLSYLEDAITKEPTPLLDPSSYWTVLSDQTYYLILRADRLDLLRDRVERTIDTYNQIHHLSGAQAEEYPFSQGTDYEKQFLQALSKLVTLNINKLQLHLMPTGPDQPQGYHQGRFYTLGQAKVVESSVVVSVKTDDRFVDVNDPTMHGHRYQIFPNEGLIALDFPPNFFSDAKSVVRVEYDYQAAQGTYLLGLFLLKGSEKVYLNGKLLQAGTDYQISYDTGLLLLLKPVQPNDTLRIDYENARGGLGGYAEYQTFFGGLRANYQVFPGFSLSLELLQARDGEPNTATPRTMPNVDTVVGLNGNLDLGSLKGQISLGYGINRFPFDDNLRQNLPNQINVVRAFRIDGQEMILFGEQNGLALYDPRANRWSHYGVSEGLAGPAVEDIAYSEAKRLLIFATNAGISVLQLELGRPPAASLAATRNWKSYTSDDGIPAGVIHAVLADEKTLWLGSDEGLSHAALDRLDHRDAWQSLRFAAHPELLSDQILKLIRLGDRLYIGTDRGLSYLDLASEKFHAFPELKGAPIHDLTLGGAAGTIYVASDAGLRSLDSAGGGGWLITDRAINAVAWEAGTLWYGSYNGLYRLPGMGAAEPATLGHDITAIAASNGTIWAGEAAFPKDNDYELLLWGINPKDTRQYPSATTGIHTRDEHDFADIPADKHTDYGWIGQVSLTQDVGPLELSATLVGVSPRYLTIGTQQRQDAVRLDFGATYPINPLLTLSADHQENLTDLSKGLMGSAREVIDSLQLSWNIGPKLQLGYRLGRTDDDPKHPGFDRTEADYSLELSQSLLGDRLATDVGIALQDHRILAGYTTPFSYQELQLNGDLVFQLVDGLTLHANASNPLSFGFAGIRGERLISWGVDWLRPLKLSGLPDLTVSANYNGQQQTILPYGSGNLAQNGQVRLQFASVQLGEVQLTPQGNVTLEQATDLSGLGTTRTLGGEVNLQGAWGPWTSQIGYKRSDATNSFDQVEQLGDHLTGSLSFGGLAGLHPSLNYSLDLQTLLHPILGQKQNVQNSLSFTLEWQPSDNPLQGSISLGRQITAQEREASTDYTLQTSWSYQLSPTLNPQIDLSADYTLGTRDDQPIDLFTGAFNLRMDYPLPGAWGATLQTGYLFGIDRISPKGSYQSLTFSVEAGMDFKL